MNEKIKELAEQAGVDYGQTLANILCGDDVHDALGIEFNKLSKETREYICEVLEKNQLKFAELIIHSCIDAVISVPLPNEYEQRCAESVREYFGIKV